MASASVERCSCSCRSRGDAARSLANRRRPPGRNDGPAATRAAQCGGYSGGNGPVSTRPEDCHCGPSRSAARSAARAAEGSPSPAHRARRIASSASRWRGSASLASTSSRSAAAGSAIRCSSTATSSNPAPSSARRRSARVGRAPGSRRDPLAAPAPRPPRQRDPSSQARVASHRPANSSASKGHHRPWTPADANPTAMASGATALSGRSPASTLPSAAGAGTAPPTPAATCSSRSGNSATRAWLAAVSHQSRRGPGMRSGPGCSGTTE